MHKIQSSCIFLLSAATLPSTTLAFVKPASGHTSPFYQVHQTQRTTMSPTATHVSLQQFAPAAISLFDNMRTPAAILAGGIVPAGIAAGFPSLVNPKDGKVAALLARLFPLVAISSLTSLLISVMWATVAVNQLTETTVPMAESVWHLLMRDYELAWAGVNTHFFMGMLGFMFVIGSRVYLTESRGPIGKSVGGIAASGMLLMISIINRGVAAGNQKGMRYGTNVLALVSRYLQLLISRAMSMKTFGPMEVAAAVMFVVSVSAASISIWNDVRAITKME